MVALYTIGYTAFNAHQMVGVLHEYEINLIIDVRSQPYSEHYPEYNKEIIEHFLKENSIYYRNYAQEFGARQTEEQFFSSEGFLDFELFAKSNCFSQGVNKVRANIDKKFIIGLLCAEKDPAVCHRSIMISRVFYNQGFSVKHILSDGSFETQRNIEYRLLEKYFPNRNQLSLFGGEIPECDLIASAYRLRNSEIGFRLNGEKT